MKIDWEKKLKITGIDRMMGNISICNYLMVIFIFIFMLNSSCSQEKHRVSILKAVRNLDHSGGNIIVAWLQ